MQVQWDFSHYIDKIGYEKKKLSVWITGHCAVEGSKRTVGMKLH